MLFHEFRTTLDCHRKIFGTVKQKDYDAFYNLLLDENKKIGGEFATAIHNQLFIEMEWYKEGRPYYNVWPGILPSLCKLNYAHIPCEYLKLPLNPLLIRFPEYAPFQIDQNHSLRSVLCGRYKAVDSPHESFYLWIDFGESEPDDPRKAVITYRHLPLRPGMDIEEVCNSLRVHWSAGQGVQISRDFIDNAVRIVTACCLIAQGDTEIIEPDVLSRDEDSFALTHNYKFVDRAKRNGKFGFHIGRHITVSPHYRQAHAALYHTGPGRAIPRVIIRRGTIVKKQDAVKVPTGFLDENHQ